MESQDHELTESIQKKISQALRIGASYELAARYAGIGMKWFWRWKNEGENSHVVDNDHYRQKCRAFSQEIKEARAEYEVACLTRMEKLGTKHFKPLHWKFEQLSALRLQSRGKVKKYRNPKYE